MDMKEFEDVVARLRSEDRETRERASRDWRRIAQTDTSGLIFAVYNSLLSLISSVHVAPDYGEEVKSLRARVAFSENVTDEIKKWLEDVEGRLKLLEAK